MKKLVSIVAAGILASLAAAPGTASAPGSDQLQRQSHFCYTGCRIECQWLHQGNQQAINQCYAQCVVDRCGATL